MGAHVPTVAIPATDHRLHLFSADRHLGVVIMPLPHQGREARARIAAARAADLALSRRVFACRRLSVNARANVAIACVLSRILYGAGRWNAMSPAAWRGLSAAALRPFKTIVGHNRPDDDGHWRTLGMLKAIRQPSLGDRVVAARLRLFAAVATTAPPHLRALVRSPAGHAWRSHITSDMRVLQAALPSKLDSLPDPASDAAPWERLVADRPLGWRKLIARFLKIWAANPAASERFPFHGADPLPPQLGGPTNPSGQQPRLRLLPPPCRAWRRTSSSPSAIRRAAAALGSRATGSSGSWRRMSSSPSATRRAAAAADTAVSACLLEPLATCSSSSWQPLLAPQ